MKKKECNGVHWDNDGFMIADLWLFYVPGFMHLVGQGKKPENILYHYNIRSMGCQLVVVFGPFCSEKNQMYEL